ncbi:hypothetical protein NDN08_000942 [Rhodosorus marinus]|uniref:START domain-containing protein n=1 Tax=Rhodosorus marinus TaxID=101924 RepID=A0AAV8UPN0_9RHOD|nr:hypothetical protein NDN08_000942 [Rhodosorus marinus]
MGAMDLITSVFEGVTGRFKGDKWNERLFRQFVERRAGNGSHDVFWYSEGDLVDVNRGLVLTKLEGLEALKLVEKPRLCENEDECHMQAMIASRKIIFHKDPSSSSYEASVNIMGQVKDGIDPVQYPFQVREQTTNFTLTSYVLTSAASVLNQLARLSLFEDGRMTIESAASKVQSGRKAEVLPPEFGGVASIDLVHGFVRGRRPPLQGPLPSPSPSTTGNFVLPFFEKYDYLLDSSPNRSLWTRHGRCPLWFGGKGSCVMHLRGRRVPKFIQLPEALQDIIEESFALFSVAPSSADEVWHQLGL